MSVAGPDIFSTALAGLGRATDRAGRAAGAIAAGRLDAAHIVELKRAETDFKANAKLIGVAARLEKSLLDILA